MNYYLKINDSEFININKALIAAGLRPLVPCDLSSELIRTEVESYMDASEEEIQSYYEAFKTGGNMDITLEQFKAFVLDQAMENGASDRFDMLPTSDDVNNLITCILEQKDRYEEFQRFVDNIELYEKSMNL